MEAAAGISFACLTFMEYLPLSHKFEWRSNGWDSRVAWSEIWMHFHSLGVCATTDGLPMRGMHDIGGLRTLVNKPTTSKRASITEQRVLTTPAATISTLHRGVMPKQQRLGPE